MNEPTDTHGNPTENPMRVHYSVGGDNALCNRPGAYRFTDHVGDVTCRKCLDTLATHPEVAT